MSLLERMTGFSPRRLGRAIRRISRLDPDVLEMISRRKALLAFEKAWKRTPAYGEFLGSKGVDPSSVRTFSDFLQLLPQTTKENYVLSFSLRARCLDGVLPSCGSLDESAGTTDTPTHWLRIPDEDRARRAITALALFYLYHLEQGGERVLINGYLPGAWAGSQRFAASLGPFGILKNTGADAAKIIQTVRDLGPGPRYLIGGYPPFLKELIDHGQSDERFDWKHYAVDILTGGEGFIEEWRDYLAARLRPDARIFSNYGAVDTDAGLCMENAFTVAVKRLAWRDAGLRQALFHDDRLPCFLGQYSPLSFYVCPTMSACGKREFDVTLLSPETASPKIRYNVGDEGGVIPFAGVRSILEGQGCRLEAIVKHPDGLPPVPFPFLYVFGRSDGTVFWDGATISPSDVQAALLADPRLSSNVRTFRMSVVEAAGAPARLSIDLELKEKKRGDGEAGLDPETVSSLAGEALVSRLLESNSCYRRAYERDPAAARPTVRAFAYQTGVFGAESDRAKFRYI